ncbi:zinc ribbon domain-containing protein [Haloarculaceae archaeon H-GB11]|nr:zinc ribbon domain-containing protein [Haloarculaceae archaeon H-GB11]
MGPVAALLFTVVLSLVPTVLFLGLWYALLALRDDDLVEQSRAMEARRPTYSSSPGARKQSPTRPDASGPSESDATVVCPRCGSRNAAGVTYCWHCLGELD